MEVLLVLVILGVLAGLVFLVGPIALIKAINASQRVAALQRQLDELQAQFALSQRSPAAQGGSEAREPVEQAAPEPTTSSAAPTPAPVATQTRTPPQTQTQTSPPRPPTPPTDDHARCLRNQGAAVAGGIFLALGGLFLFKVSIDRGWISPLVRVLMGVGGGLGCILAAQTQAARRYAITASALTGAGCVMLYAAFWGARVLYGLIDPLAAFVAMGSVTATCVWLSLRDSSRLVALLGLLGGFATPLLLSTGTDRPLALFGWILMLDLAFLGVARARGWSWLTGLCVAGTLLYEVLWIGDRMGPDRLWLGLGIVSVFGALFAVAGRAAPAEQAAGWRWSRLAGLVVPLGFGLYFAGRADLGAHLWPTALMMAMVHIGACLAERDGPLPLGVAVASLPVVGLWLAGQEVTEARLWEAGAILVVLAGIQHGFAELRRGGRGLNTAAIAALGSIVVLLPGHVVGEAPPWPGLVAVAALCVLLLRQSMARGQAALQGLAAAALALVMGLPFLSGSPGADFPPAETWLAVMAAAALTLQAWASARAGLRGGRVAGHSAAAFAATCLGLLAVAPGAALLHPTVAGIGALFFFALLVHSATRLDAGPWYVAAVAGLALTFTTWTFGAVADGSAQIANAQIATANLSLAIAGMLAAALWPFFTTSAFRSSRSAWVGAAVAAPLFFATLLEGFQVVLTDQLDGLPALLCGLLYAVMLSHASRLWSPDSPMRRAVVILFATVTCGFLSMAVPLQLENSWITIGWALQGLAVLGLWRRLDHAGLKYFALALFAAVFVRLVFNPWVLEYELRGTIRIVNWLAYTYLVPAAAMIAGARLLAPSEIARQRSWERWSTSIAVTASVLSLAAVAVIFAWLNLAVVDWYGQGQSLQLDFARHSARDLTFSIVWAVYALVLLGVGVWRTSRSLRWVSLLLLVVTIGKVFLYDFGELQDLYRVASFVGLGVSLTAVSLLYQRFVFRVDAGWQGGAQRPAHVG